MTKVTKIFLLLLSLLSFLDKSYKRYMNDKSSRKVAPAGAAKSFSINRLRLSINQASLMFCIRLALLVSQARIITKYVKERACVMHRCENKG